MGKPVLYDTGTVFGKWSVLSSAGSRSGKLLWNVLCECGNKGVVVGADLRSGKSTCCGCDRPGFTTHGLSDTPLYFAWGAMLNRCNNPKAINYADYGGRGIKVCERWMKFENFYADMGERPPDHEIDREDNDGNYEPGNCRWVTKSTNARNTRATVFVDYMGKKMSMAEAAELSGIPYHVLKNRIRLNTNPDIFRPVKTLRRKP